MDKRKILVSVMICICLLLTACGGVATERDNNVSGGASGSAVSGAALSDTTDTTVRSEELPDIWMAKGYLMYVVFRIKERTTEGYRAEVVIEAMHEDMWKNDPYPNWEICLDLEDEIVELSEAEIVSREGIRYTIRGTGDNRDRLDNDKKLRFDIVVRCPDGAHQPGLCYLKKEMSDVDDDDYEFEVMELGEEGTAVHGTLLFTNCSDESLYGWTLDIEANFQIQSMSSARIWQEDKVDGLWEYEICGEGEKCSLGKGESVEISFTGKCTKEKPYMSGGDFVKSGKDTDIDWSIIEKLYGKEFEAYRQHWALEIGKTKKDGTLTFSS